MPNHYTNMLVLTDIEWDESNEDPEYVPGAWALKGWAEKPLNRAMPMPVELEGTEGMGPGPNWYDWQVKNRGCKWDAYDVAEPVTLNGDSWSTLQVFVTAWGPPNEACRNLMAAELHERGFKSVMWLGVNPYDMTSKLIQQWDFKADAKTEDSKNDK